MNNYHIVSRSRSFFESGQTRCLCFRLNSLQKLKSALTENKQLLLAALHADLNKSKHETWESEIEICLKEIDFHCNYLTCWAAEKRVKTPVVFFPTASMIIAEPKGVVLIMSPWNFPIALTIMPLVGAISAGNCAILKPSEFSPATSEALAKLISSTFDPGYISVVQADASRAQDLVTLPFDHIFFTGSTRVGKLVMSAAAQNLTPLTLELGGCNPCIVDKEIDIEIAARRIVWAKFYNAGQSCLAPNYLLVDQQIEEPFIHEMKAIMKEWYQDAKYPFARIVNQFHFERLDKLLETQTIVAGGDAQKISLLIEPTLTKTTFVDPIVHEEIFGPVLPIISYNKIDMILEKLKTMPKPLACYFFSKSKRLQNHIINNVCAGSICINDAIVQYANLHLPFGGVGASGFGSYHGKKSFESFTHYKSVMRRSFWFDWQWRYQQ
ncbi:aldehyde dehydrogenase family protein [Candidatus Dependentiae bacterium]|nr:aldehyde dehydrogenase family protein [Candidatus Dependentiae bacterium]